MEVEISSQETIKPSTPTPPHLKSYKFSLLDQLLSVVEYRTPVIYFYTSLRNKNNHYSIVDHLKDTLSETLSLFYPLAGRVLVHESTIRCNDKGAPFVVASVKCSLFSFLRMSNLENLLPQLVPNDAVDKPHVTDEGLVPMAIQISMFDCGGVAIGSHFLHKILDGITRNNFFKTWAALAASRYNDVVLPDLTSVHSVFPPLPHFVAQAPTKPLVLRPLSGTADACDGLLHDKHSGGTCVVKAFAFDRQTIAALQAKATSESVPNPTRVESVSCFIWNHLMAAAAKADSLKSSIPGKETNIIDHQYENWNASALVHSVDMRSHLRPPLPPNTCGKFTTHAIAYCKGQYVELPDLVALLRKAISDTKDVKFLSRFQGVAAEEAILEHKQKLKNLKNDPKVNTYSFTTWSGHHVDFGFGLPVWIGFSGGRLSSWFRNFIPLIDVPGVGLQAWLILDEQEMALLKSDVEFLKFASPSTGLVLPLYSSL